MTAARSVFRLAVFILTALPVIFGQATPSADDTKNTAEKQAAEKAGKGTTPGAQQTPADPSTTKDPVHVLVLAVAKDQLSLDVTTAANTACQVDSKCSVIHLISNDSAVKDQLKQLHKGDHIQVVYATDAKSQNTLKTFCADTLSPGWLSIAWVLLASAGVCLLLYCIFSGFKPTQLIIGEDNRYSNSKFQMALWFFVLITTYVAALWLRVLWAGWDFIGGVEIPKNLLLLSGLSALTFGGAKGITSSKNAAPETVGQKKKSTTPPRFFFDLTHDDGKPAVAAQPAAGNQPAVAAQPATPPQFDFGDFQMLIVTLIAVTTYIVLILNFFGSIEYSKAVTLPDVDTTLLATFGLGQGAYLTKKAVGNVGTS
jgi:hypothetical protein